MWILLLALLLGVVPGSEAVTHADLLEPLQHTLNLIYNMEFEEALRGANALRERAPTHPAGFFALAATYWQWRLVTTEAQPRSTLLEQFQSAIHRTREAAENLPQAQAPETAFYLGAAYGMQARMYFVEKQYLRALLAARQGSAYLQQCVTRVPAWYDAYAGLGTYYYVLTRVPAPWRGIVQQLIGLHGDSTQGVHALEQAMTHGQLAVPEATLLLAKIYTLPDERHYEQAASLLASLVQHYPNNIDYRYRLALVYAALGQWHRTQDVTQTLLADLERSSASYARRWLPLLRYRLAESALCQHHVALAFEMLMALHGQELTPSLRAWVELRLGNVHDVRDERQAARAWYAGITADAEAERLARLYLSRPFTGAHMIMKPVEHSAI